MSRSSSTSRAAQSLRCRESPRPGRSRRRRRLVNVDSPGIMSRDDPAGPGVMSAPLPCPDREPAWLVSKAPGNPAKNGLPTILDGRAPGPGTRVPEDRATWVPGCVATWVFGDRATRVPGRAATRMSGDRATRVPEHAATWVFEDQATQVPGRVATWVFGDRPTRVPEHAATRMSGDRPTRVPEHAATRMSGDRATRVPEHAATWVFEDQATQVPGRAATWMFGDRATRVLKFPGCPRRSLRGRQTRRSARPCQWHDRLPELEGG